MAVYNVKFYDISPAGAGFPNNSGAFVYLGPGTPTGDAAIEDNGTGIAGQTLEGATVGEDATANVTVNGLTSTGTDVQASKAWEVTDSVTGLTFVVVQFHVVTGDASGQYTLSEQPLVPGRSYTALQSDNSPDAEAGDPVFTYANYVCIGPGAMIACRDGLKPVEAIARGDLVKLRGGGHAPVHWCASRTVCFSGKAFQGRPVLLPRGCLGPGLPARDLILSPQHRIEVQQEGRGHVLIPDKSFDCLPGIRIMRGRRSVRYHALLTRAHSVIYADALPVETLLPAGYARKLMPAAQRISLAQALMGLAGTCTAAAPVLSVAQGRRLLSEGRFRLSGPGPARPGGGVRSLPREGPGLMPGQRLAAAPQRS